MAIGKCILAWAAGLLLGAAAAQAQTPPVPSQYQALDTELSGLLNGFDAKIAAGWNQSLYPTAFSGELLYANGNNGRALLAPNVFPNVIIELNALQRLGLRAVVVKVGFPLLYQPFLTYNGDPQDHAAFLAFYQQVAEQVHVRGMKLIVECSPIYPGFYSQAGGVNVGPWYASLSNDQLNAARAVELAIVAAQIQPDYLTIDAEPDTLASLTGQSSSLTPAGFAADINAIMAQLPADNAVPIGAGVGAWDVPTGTAYVQTLISQTKINYIDLHFYELNPPTGVKEDIAQNLITLANTAIALGKPVGVSEFWSLKEFDSEYATTNLATDPTVESRDAFSFWAPLDEQYHTEFYKFANWKQLLFLSGFWSRYYWANLDYSQYGSLPAPTIVSDSINAAGTALATGQVTPLGTFVQGLNAAYGSPPGNSALLAATLPGGRSVQLGAPATVFATMLNTGTAALNNCRVVLPAPVPQGLAMTFQTTDPRTNTPTGQPNQPVTIPGHDGAQTFVLAFQSSAAQLLSAQPVGFNCDGTPPAPAATGIDTVDLDFTTGPVTDIIALAATASNNGIVTVPYSQSGYGAFALATVNAGAAGSLTVSADTGGFTLPVGMSICATNAATAQCLAPPAASVPVTIAAGATPTFSVFAKATASIALTPGASRIYVRFTDSSGVSHGSTSVAVVTD